MMPLTATAWRMPCAPYGLNPLAAVKLEALKFVIAKTKIVSSGIATFHQVTALLVSASFLTPRKLIEVISAIKTIATIRPIVVRTASTLLRVQPAVRELVVLAVGDHRQHLDRCDRGRLQPGEPPERGAGGATERVVREPRGAARDRVHPAELGVDEGQRPRWRPRR